MKRLGYSEGSAQRRISAARAIRDFPAVHEALLSRKLSLTAIAILSGSFTDDVKAAELVAKAQGKTQQQILAIAAAEKPRSSPTRDRIEAEAVLVPAPEPVSDLAAPSASCAASEVQPPRADAALEPPAPRAPEPIVIERFKFVFSAGPAFKQKLDRVRTLLSGKYPTGASLETAFEVLLDEYIERHAPERRAALRAERKARAGREAPMPSRETSPSSSGISQALRDEIYVRDGGRCTYALPDGTRCDSTWDLEIDHEMPVAKGGKTSAANCRLRCRVHNVHAARVEFGDEVVDRGIAASRKTVSAIEGLPP